MNNAKNAKTINEDNNSWVYWLDIHETMLLVQWTALYSATILMLPMFNVTFVENFNCFTKMDFFCRSLTIFRWIFVFFCAVGWMEWCWSNWDILNWMSYGETSEIEETDHLRLRFSRPSNHITFQSSGPPGIFDSFYWIKINKWYLIRSTRYFE